MFKASGGFYNIRAFQRTLNQGHVMRRKKRTQWKLTCVQILPPADAQSGFDPDISKSENRQKLSKNGGKTFLRSPRRHIFINWSNYVHMIYIFWKKFDLGSLIFTHHGKKGFCAAFVKQYHNPNVNDMILFFCQKFWNCST